MLRELKLIAEPWDIGPGGYRLGAFPAGWGEWNDRYRDTVRRFWRGDAGMTGELATRLAGSADVFAARSRPPSRSVNFVTAHDGFTLADLVAYARKHNEANGEDNRDGTDANHSWNHGVEGPTDDPAVRARARARRAQPARHAAASRAARRCWRWATSSAARSTATTTPMRRTTRSPGSTGTRADRGAGRLRRRADRAAPRHPALRADRWLDRRAGRRERHPRRRVAAPRRPARWTRDDWAHRDDRALVAVLYAPRDGRRRADRVAVALQRRARRRRGALARAARRACAGACASTPRCPAGGRRDAAVAGEPATRRRAVGGRARRGGGRRAARTRTTGVEPEVLDRLAAAAGIAPDWLDVDGHAPRRRRRHAARAARGDGPRRAHDRARRASAWSRSRRSASAGRCRATCVAREGAPLVVAARVDRRRRAAPAMRLRAHGARTGRDDASAVRRRRLPRERACRRPTAARWRSACSALPPLPAGVSHAAPRRRAGRALPPHRRAARVPPAARRCATAAAASASPRTSTRCAGRGDQGIGDFTTLARARRAPPRARAAPSSASTRCTRSSPATASARAPTTRPTAASSIRSTSTSSACPDFAGVGRGARAARGARPAHRRARGARDVDYAGVWAVEARGARGVLRGFERAPRRRSAASRSSTASSPPAASALRRFALFEAIAAAHPRHAVAALARRRCADPTTPGVARLRAARTRARVRFALYLQWLADRQLGDAARDARAGGLALGFYRDLAVGAAPDGAEAWAHPRPASRAACRSARRPIRSRRGGQVWNLPPPIPHALTAVGLRRLPRARSPPTCATRARCASTT